MAGYGMPNDDEGAAFGVYPQMARRRESNNDRVGAREVPVQAARGMVAGTLGMAGDLEGLARTGARFLGANVQEAPALPTSDELRERLPVPATSPAGRAAGAVGAAVGLPAVGFGMKAATEAAPAVRRIAAEVAENARMPQPMNRASRNQAGAIVWHGSPHTFDKFDAAKIGSGEGHQVYGHGVYLSEDKGVADAYRQNLTDMNGGLARVDQYAGLLGSGPRNTVAQGMEGRQQLITHLERQLAERPHDPYLPRMLKAAREELAALDDVGSLYKTDLADEAVPRMIDWGERMSAQTPGVQRGMERALSSAKLDPETRQLLAQRGHGEDPWAHNLLTTLAIDDNLGKAGSAALLRDQGIAGVKFKDKLTLGADVRNAARNFVVYPGNEGLLRILERNGRPIE